LLAHVPDFRHNDFIYTVDFRTFCIDNTDTG
jgi:hypothetical protein